MIDRTTLPSYEDVQVVQVRWGDIPDLTVNIARQCAHEWRSGEGYIKPANRYRFYHNLKCVAEVMLELHESYKPSELEQAALDTQDDGIPLGGDWDAPADAKPRRRPPRWDVPPERVEFVEWL